MRSGDGRRRDTRHCAARTRAPAAGRLVLSARRLSWVHEMSSKAAVAVMETPEAWWRRLNNDADRVPRIDSYASIAWAFRTGIRILREVRSLHPAGRRACAHACWLRASRGRRSCVDHLPRCSAVGAQADSYFEEGDREKAYVLYKRLVQLRGHCVSACARVFAWPAADTTSPRLRSATLADVLCCSFDLDVLPKHSQYKLPKFQIDRRQLREVSLHHSYADASEFGLFLICYGALLGLPEGVEAA